MTRLIIVTVLLILVAIAQSRAQQITNSGDGIAGNGATAATQRYDIDISEDGGWIVVNGKWWPIVPSVATSPFAHVVKWDAVKNKWVPFGMIKAMTLDGTQFMGGTIFIRTTPRMKVTSFKAVPYYTPKVMPSLQTRNQDVLVVRVYSPWTGTFVPRPDLYLYYLGISGTIWFNNDYTLHSAVLDGQGIYGSANGGLVIVPAPAGPANTPQLLPSKMK